MNIIKSAKISRFLLKSVRDFNEFHTPRHSPHMRARGIEYTLSQDFENPCNWSITIRCVRADVSTSYTF